MRLVELAHVIEDGMEAYPGLPPARVEPILDHAASRERYRGEAEFYLGRFAFPGNVGTYIDSPFHRFPEGDDLAALPLERVAALPGLCRDAVFEANGRAVGVAGSADDLRARAVLVRTHWDARFGTPAYWRPGPYLAPEFVERLIAAPAALVGVDFANVDDADDPARPAHTRLLAADIPIVEHLTGLAQLPERGFRFYAVPLRVRKGASIPVRAFAEIDDG